MLSIAQELGADTDNVTVKLEQRDKILKLNGTVPGSLGCIVVLQTRKYTAGVMNARGSASIPGAVNLLYQLTDRSQRTHQKGY